MYTIAFYSYRGGIERTRALVNVGVDLARRGRKVLLIDWDLEAPYLTHLNPLLPEQPRPGLVEYITEYRDTNQVPPIRDYLYQAASVGETAGKHLEPTEIRESLEKIREKRAELLDKIRKKKAGKHLEPAELRESLDNIRSENDSKLWVMPAGREDRDYWEALPRLDWQEFYDQHEGFLFFEDTRLQWQNEGFEYVLIHAPHGINDPMGICTRQLPDLVVLVSTTDQTDLNGLELVCADIRAEAEQKNPKEIALQLVLAGVQVLPSEDPRRLREQADSLREQASNFASQLGLYGTEFLLLPDDRGLSVKRSVVQDKPRSRAGRAYRRLTQLCLMANCENDRDGALLFLKDLERRDPFQAIETGPEGEGVPHFSFFLQIGGKIIIETGPEGEGVPHRPGERVAPARRLGRILRKFTGDTQIILQGAECLFKARRYFAALEALDGILEKSPEAIEFRLRRADLWISLKQTEAAVKDLRCVLETPGLKHALVLEAMQRLRGLPLEKEVLDGVLEKSPGAIEVRLRRADLLTSLKAVKELMCVLDTAGVKDAQVLEAMRRLRRLSIEKFEEAQHKPAVQALKGTARMLINLLGGRPTSPGRINEAASALESHNWQAVIDLLEPRVTDPSFAAIDAFQLAVAYWGKTSEVPVEMCKRGVELFDKQPNTGGLSDLGDFQLLSLMCWGAGDKERALQVLRVVEEQASSQYSSTIEDVQNSLVSFWRHCWVPLDQFLEDCNEMGLMMKGGLRIKPLFLDPAFAV